MKAELLTGVRDRLWLLAHDDERDMRPYVDVRALNIGLVAATLTDLLLDELIEIREGLIHPTAGSTDPPLDLIAYGILTTIRDDGTAGLADVMRGARADTSGSRFNPYLRLYQRTRADLVTIGILTDHRRALRPAQYRLADPYTTARLRGLFNYRLVYHRGEADLATDSLYALIWALNLHRALTMPYPSSEADPILYDITERIPARAGPTSPLSAVPQLAFGVRRAVGDLATSAF